MPSSQVLISLVGSASTIKALPLIEKLLAGKQAVTLVYDASCTDWLGLKTLQNIPGLNIALTCQNLPRAEAHYLLGASSQHLHAFAAGIGSATTSGIALEAFLAHDFTSPYTIIFDCAVSHPITRKAIADLKSYGVQIISDLSKLVISTKPHVLLAAQKDQHVLAGLIADRFIKEGCSLTLVHPEGALAGQASLKLSYKNSAELDQLLRDELSKQTYQVAVHLAPQEEESCEKLKAYALNPKLFVVSSKQGKDTDRSIKKMLTSRKINAVLQRDGLHTSLHTPTNKLDFSSEEQLASQLVNLSLQKT